MLGGKLIRKKSKRKGCQKIDREVTQEVTPLRRSQSKAKRKLREQGRADRQVGPGKPGAVGVGEPVTSIKEMLGRDQADEQEDQKQNHSLDQLDHPRSQQFLEPERQQLLLPLTAQRSLQPTKLANLAANPLSVRVVVLFLTLIFGAGLGGSALCMNRGRGVFVRSGHQPAQSADELFAVFACEFQPAHGPA